MKTVIFGADLIGGQFRDRLEAEGYDAIALGGFGIEYHRQGIADAIEGAHVVVDLTNAPSRVDGDVLACLDPTRHLIAAPEAAGVRGSQPQRATEFRHRRALPNPERCDGPAVLLVDHGVNNRPCVGTADGPCLEPRAKRAAWHAVRWCSSRPLSGVVLRVT